MKYNYSKALIELRSKPDILQTKLASIYRWENKRTNLTKIVKVKIEKICRDNGINLDKEGKQWDIRI